VQILAGRISDRIGRARVMLPGMLLTGISFGCDQNQLIGSSNVKPVLG
jgi:MFS family permease